MQIRLSGPFSKTIEAITQLVFLASHSQIELNQEITKKQTSTLPRLCNPIPFAAINLHAVCCLPELA